MRAEWLSELLPPNRATHLPAFVCAHPVLCLCLHLRMRVLVFLIPACVFAGLWVNSPDLLVDVAALSTVGMSQRTRAPVFRLQGDTESFSGPCYHMLQFNLLLQSKALIQGLCWVLYLSLA